MKWPIALLSILSIALSAIPASGQVTLVATGSVWKYLHNGADEGILWRTNSFDDNPWPVGAGQFGWGEGDEQTLLVLGPPDDEVPITLYFRHTFQVTNPIVTVTLRLLRDDGAIVYINGREVVRDNMPLGPVTFQTFAVQPVQTNENLYVQYGLFSDVFRPGANVIAVEVHRAPGSAGWEDCSFDLELTANQPLGGPRVSVVSPPNGTTVLPGAFFVAAESSDDDGHVARVEFFLDDDLVLTRAEPPFGGTVFETSPGRHRLRAVAYDNYGFFNPSRVSSFQVGADLPVNLARGPYLQLASATGMVVRWNTDWPTNSILRLGTNPANLDTVLTAPSRTNEHELFTGGLRPDTVYHYHVAASGQILSGTFSFRTAPTNARPARVWIIGDSGMGNAAQDAVRDAYYLDANGGIETTDLWLMLGDNAYDSGTDDEYQVAVFDKYRDLLARAPVWPTLGNHDAASPGLPGQFPYLDMFTLPAQGECGGVPSGTEKYYSFDHANIHFVCLDTESSASTAGSPMLAWLEEDLGATDRDWVVAFFHRPPYSFGSHHSDLDITLTRVRERFLPILEAHGVDLVLSGHSHVYERSFLLRGHYGYSWTLTPGMILDAGLGRTNTSPYFKPAGGLGANGGTVYAVCGCSGEGGYMTVNLHPAMATNSGGYGSMILDFDGLKLNGRFLRSDGVVHDYFTIDKSRPAAVRPELSVARSGDNVAISWPTSVPAYDLETAMTAQTNAAWTEVTNVVETIGRKRLVNAAPERTNRFFRLRAR